MKKEGNGIVLVDIPINVVALFFCIYNIYKMFHVNAQENIGVENLFGMYWIIAAIILAVFLVFDLICLKSKGKKKGDVGSNYNNAIVIMSILLKVMMAFLAIVYLIIV